MCDQVFMLGKASVAPLSWSGANVSLFFHKWSVVFSFFVSVFILLVPLVVTPHAGIIWNRLRLKKWLT